MILCGGDDDVDLVPARRALEQRGLTRILSEGGPMLFADLASAGVLDELCLSLSPCSPGPARAASSPGQLGRGGTVTAAI